MDDKLFEIFVTLSRLAEALVEQAGRPEEVQEDPEELAKKALQQKLVVEEGGAHALLARIAAQNGGSIGMSA